MLLDVTLIKNLLSLTSRNCSFSEGKRTDLKNLGQTTQVLTDLL